MTNADSNIIGLLGRTMCKELFFTKKASIEPNWKTKHTFIFVLRAAFVMIVAHGWFRTCSRTLLVCMAYLADFDDPDNLELDNLADLDNLTSFTDLEDLIKEL